jgi:hypothetical protein
VLKETPAAFARIFARLDHVGHDWLKPLLGEGREVREPYGVREYDVSLPVAEQILAEEVERASAPDSNYSPAVVEIERELQWTGRRLFNPGIRFVDTQGLDQQLPEDLIRMAQVDLGKTTIDRFKQWIHQTPRGRHMDWQYRRCDAALWCVHAKRVGSAVTGASLQYFRPYGKRTVIALTNIDRFPDSARVIEQAREKYSGQVDYILPIAGKLALEASISGSLGSIAASGLEQLVETLTRLCVTDGARVRIVSQYISLRTTERQLRQALRTFREEIEETQRQMVTCRDRIDTAERKALDRVDKALEASSETQIGFVWNNLSGLELSDDGFTALFRMKPEDARIRHETEALQAVRVAQEGADALSHELASNPFRLPTFDADGKRAGDSVRFQARIPAPVLRFHFSPLQIELKGMFLKGVELWAREKVLGFFSAAARKSAARERRKLEDDRKRDAANQFKAAWGVFTLSVRAECHRGVRSVFDEMRDSVAAVESSLEQVEREPLSATRDRLVSVLSHVCNPPVIVGTIVERFRTVLGAAGFRTSPSAGA